MISLRIGNAPCSWGTIEFDDDTSARLGYRRILDELTETGYTGTEMGDWGFMPTEPVALRAELDQRGLTMIGSFVSVPLYNPGMHAEGEALALRTARLLAAVNPNLPAEQQPCVVLAEECGVDPVRTLHAGRITPEQGFREDQWPHVARGAERIALAVRDQTGLRTVFHPHCAGYIETPDEIARLLDLTNPDLLGLAFDTGHYTYGSGGDDPGTVRQALARFGDRIAHVHFKDCSPQVAAQARAAGWEYNEAVRHGLFCELGQGSVDFPAMVAWLRDRDYQGWIVVEQDVLAGMGTPRESAARNRAYLASLGL